MRTRTNQDEEIQVRTHEQVPVQPEIPTQAEREAGADDERLLTEREVNDLRLAAQVESKLREIYPCEVVGLQDGIVT
ncbi:MAG: hypothetical protein RDU20_10405, partial [Desulfomonilaceae bacterium]|nr:hypothetical protein [Desulfomonilaceae bacterium]